MGRRTPDWGLVTAFSVLAAIVSVDLATGERIALGGSYALSALVAALLTTTRRTALVAAVAAAAAAASGWWNHNTGSLEWRIRLVLCVLLGALSVVAAEARRRRERRLVRMIFIADTVQRAVLGDVPTSVGRLRLACRYVSATREASIGGDLYAVVSSERGTRVVVGDVRGKGLDAVQLAATVLSGFRRAADVQPDLVDVARDLDDVVARVAGDEDFVTAVLVELHEDDEITVVTCGHPPPLLIGPGGVTELDVGPAALPLGLGSQPEAVRVTWPPASRLLLYTDGLIEARDSAGRFFDVASASEALASGTLTGALDDLVRRLTRHAGSRLADDLALMLLERRPTRTAQPEEPPGRAGRAVAQP